MSLGQISGLEFIELASRISSPYYKEDDLLLAKGHQRNVVRRALVVGRPLVMKRSKTEGGQMSRSKRQLTTATLSPTLERKKTLIDV